MPLDKAICRKQDDIKAELQLDVIALEGEEPCLILGSGRA
jgi:hypothetical protein